LLGPLRPELAESLGLSDLQVVLPATHDTASAVAAVPAKAGKDWAYLSSGTWSLLGLELDAPVATPEAFKANFTNEGGVDGTVRFLKNIPGLWVLQQLRQERAPELDYGQLMAMAETAPSLRCLFDAGHAELLKPESMSRTVVKLCRAKGGKEPSDLAGILRASLESLALEYRHAKEQCEKLSGRTLKRLHIVGGGSQNSLLCQMTADATGLEVLAGPSEASSLGNGLMQARGMGKLGSLAEARALVAASFPPLRYEPRMSDDWERAWARYQSLKEQEHA
jgi:rhamnulokinase